MWINLDTEQDLKKVAEILAQVDHPAFQHVAEQLKDQLGQQADWEDDMENYRAACHTVYGTKEFTIDDDAPVSFEIDKESGDELGAWVMGWQWISAQDAALELEDWDEFEEQEPDVLEILRG